MANKRTVHGALVPVGFQVMNLSNSTAVAINSTARGSGNVARVLDISVETTAARYRADGTAPTNNTGVVIETGRFIRMTGYNGTSQLKFARSGGSSSSKVSIMSYKYVGD
jgi:hypothetical protein